MKKLLTLIFLSSCLGTSHIKKDGDYTKEEIVVVKSILIYTEDGARRYNIVEIEGHRYIIRHSHYGGEVFEHLQSCKKH